MLAMLPLAPPCSLLPGRYVAFLNEDWPAACTQQPPWLPDFDSFHISTNAQNKFLGSTIATIYRAGNLPYFSGAGPGGACADGDWNCTQVTAHYGGLPQLTNVTAHLERLQLDIERLLPDPLWSGVASIDWEHWKPVFSANRYREYWIYINQSEALARHRAGTPPVIQLLRFQYTPPTGLLAGTSEPSRDAGGTSDSCG